MNSRYTHVSPQEVRAELERGSSVTIVDVRNRWEYDLRHIPQATLMPMGEFAGRCCTELAPTDRIILVCEHGVRSESAAQYLASLGYEQVSTMTGGMSVYNGLVEGEA